MFVTRATPQEFHYPCQAIQIPAPFIWSETTYESKKAILRLKSQIKKALKPERPLGPQETQESMGLARGTVAHDPNKLRAINRRKLAIMSILAFSTWGILAILPSSCVMLSAGAKVLEMLLGSLMGGLTGSVLGTTVATGNAPLSVTKIP